MHQGLKAQLVEETAQNSGVLILNSRPPGKYKASQGGGVARETISNYVDKMKCYQLKKN